MTEEINMRLHDSPIQKFTTFFLYPFCCDCKIKAATKWNKQPFEIPEKENKLENNWGLQKNYAEYIYFHDYVRAFLFPQEPKQKIENQDRKPEKEVVHFYRRKVNNAHVTLGTFDGNEISAILFDIYLYQFPNNIWILVLETSNTRDDVEGGEDKKEATVADSIISSGEQLLLFNNILNPWHYICFWAREL